MKKIIISMVLVLTGLQMLTAQQDAQYTQYMYNTMAINPAYAGSRGVLSINALHRSQWVGLDGAPNTQTFNVHSPVSDRVGLGFSIVNDEIGNGTNQETQFDAVFSYTIPTGLDGNLSFGLNASGNLLNVDFTKLQNFAPDLNAMGNEDIDNRFSPNFGAGVYYHTSRFYAGLSVPRFLETEYFDGSGQNSGVVGSERMNLYFMSGMVFDLNPNLKFKPATLFKAVSGAPLQVDLSANFMFNDTFTLGAAYRLNAAVSALVGFQVSDGLMLGLAYDRETTQLGGAAFNDGSFEVMLRYEFVKKHRNIITPRFF